MPDRLLGIFRDKSFELCLGILMLEVSLFGSPKYGRKLCPGIGRAHVDYPHRLNASTRRLDPKEPRSFAALHAAPELLFRSQKQMLVERIGGYLDLDPFAAA